MESKKNIDKNEIIYKTEMDSQKTNLWLPKWKKWGDPLATWKEREERVYVCGGDHSGGTGKRESIYLSTMKPDGAF